MRIQQRCHAVFLGAVSVLVLVACSPSGEQGAAAAPAMVSVITLSPGPLEVVEDIPGRVAAVRTAEIRPQVGGIVQRRLFDQGSEVTAGQALYQINPAPFKSEVAMATAALQKAQATLARARVQVERLGPLMQADAVSRQAHDDALSQRDQAAADVAQAQAALERRQLDLRFATVEAPISGRIDQTLVSEGALVSPNDASPMARIQQIDRVYIDLRQPHLSAASPGSAHNQPRRRGEQPRQADVLYGDGTATGLSGGILFSGINIDAGTGDVLLRMLVNNPKRQLLPGMYVQARVLQARYAEALTVPQQAVIRSADKARVWIVDEQQHAHTVPVELGELVDRRYRIAAGVRAGQRVVVEGMERLAEDAPVVARVWSATAQVARP